MLTDEGYRRGLHIEVIVSGADFFGNLFQVFMRHIDFPSSPIEVHYVINLFILLCAIEREIVGCRSSSQRSNNESNVMIMNEVRSFNETALRVYFLDEIYGCTDGSISSKLG